MRAVVQRAREARVEVDGEVVGRLERPGLLALIGVTHSDTVADAHWIARKLWELRILPHEQSASDVSAPVLIVSQFTLYADARKGRRPSWNNAAPASVAEPLVEEVIAELQRRGAEVATGRFGADMQVYLVNDGPVTLVLDSPTQ